MNLRILLVVAVIVAGCSGHSDPMVQASEPSASQPNPSPPSTPSAPTPSPLPQGDASLASLDLSVGQLDQIFQPNQKTYSAKLGYLDNKVSIAATPTDPAASVLVNGTLVSGPSSAVELAEGTNSVAVTVENGSAQQTYSIDLERHPHSAFRQTHYLKAPRATFGNYFGEALALSGDTLVAGAPYENGGSRGIDGDPNDLSRHWSGAAYVFARNPVGNWSQQAYLKADNADATDAFGQAVAISGDSIAVGAACESSKAQGIGGDETDNSTPCSGAVYIFRRDSSEQWHQEAYIKASDAGVNMGFGKGVALDGDTLVVSARHKFNIGCIYIFRRDENGVWSEQAAITASDSAEDFGFGNSLALEGDTLIVGSPFHGGVPTLKGAVYVFERSGGAWSEKIRLQGSNTEDLDNFGWSVALSGTTFAVGATGESSGAVGVDGNQRDNSKRDSGAAYVFEKGAGGWAQVAYVKASNTDSRDLFGYSVALSGDWLAVTADGEASVATEVDGVQTDNSRPDSGAAYLFVRDAHGKWSQQLYLKAANADVNDQFGRSSAALSRAMLIVGAPAEASNAVGVDGDQSNNSVQWSGAVYVFE
jgi:hypothetical protein